MEIMTQKQGEMKKERSINKEVTMKKIMMVAVLGVIILSGVKEALASWQSTEGTVIYDPAPIFKEVLY